MKNIKREDLIIRESMSMPFAGGEIFFIQLDSLSIHVDLVKTKFLKDMIVVRRPSSPSLIAVNIAETLITQELANIIVQNFSSADRFITKVAFVGCDSDGKKYIKGCFNGLTRRINFGYKFINDFEKAKEWLVSEGNGDF